MTKGDYFYLGMIAGIFIVGIVLEVAAFFGHVKACLN